MNMPYRVRVFGKAGCDKCHTLNQRLNKLLQQPEWQGFEKEAIDVETEEGLVEFCEAECLNPQRIPAMLLMRWDEEQGGYVALPNLRMTQQDAVCGKAKLYHNLGLQTDYSAAGRGVITPRMLVSVLSEALG